MIIYNYHTHTSRCGHASGTDEEYVQAAIKAGYKVLGFSDHAPYRHLPDPVNRMAWEELDGYISSITYLKEKYKDQIEIHLGLETEYAQDYLEERWELKNKVEYIILGQHFIDVPRHYPSFFRTNTDDEIRLYAKTLCAGMDSGLFTYVAHPDVFLNRQSEFTDVCREAAHMIGKKAQENDLPLEINIRGVSKGKKEFKEGLRYYYPHKDFWKILSQYDIKAVIGIDAHSPKNLLDQRAVEDGLKELFDLNIDIIKDPFI